MAEAVHEHPRAKEILAEGKAEQSIFHIDETTGELVKIRPDWMVEDLVVDVKTAVSADQEEFSKHCYNYRYFVQAPFYMDVAAAATGQHLTTFVSGS